jgi:hypothetical protein
MELDRPLRMSSHNLENTVSHNIEDAFLNVKRLPNNARWLLDGTVERLSELR